MDVLFRTKNNNSDYILKKVVFIKNKRYYFSGTVNKKHLWT